MREYVIYCLEAGVRLVAAEWIEAEHDAQAMAAAAALGRGSRREVWDHDRLVGQIELDPGDP